MVIQRDGRGKRSSPPTGRILIHQPTGGYQGQSSDVEIHARETLALRAQLGALYARHTGQPAERIHEDSDRDRYMTPEEARDYGLIDRIVEAKRRG